MHNHHPPIQIRVLRCLGISIQSSLSQPYDVIPKDKQTTSIFASRANMETETNKNWMQNAVFDNKICIPIVVCCPGNETFVLRKHSV